MGRVKGFNERDILTICAATFTTHGYEGTSIDQLVASTGLLRGSIYGTFGSKRGLFLATLKEAFSQNIVSQEQLDLCLVALLELAPHDNEVKLLVKNFFAQSRQNDWSRILGDRLIERSTIVIDKV